MFNEIIIPQNAVLELTYLCNHKCKFCSCPWESTDKEIEFYQKGEELNFSQWKKAIDILIDLGVENVSISGGECLMKDCLIDILQYIRQSNKLNNNKPIVLISNGLLINNKYLDIFKRLNIHLSMSLPGIETFEYHTNVNNAKGVLYWLREAKQIGLCSTINITVTKQNFHELYSTIANALIYGADTILLNRFLAGGRGLKYQKDLSLNKEQIKQMLIVTENLLSRTKRYGSVGTEIPLCLIDKTVKYNHLSIGSKCAATKQFFVIDPSGFIRTCNHSPQKVGHIFDKPIINNTQYWLSFQNSDFLPPTCLSCQEVNQCDCGCREVANIINKDLHSKDICLEDK